MDILTVTLEAGVKVKKYVPTFGDLPNDVKTVTKCTLPIPAHSLYSRVTRLLYRFQGQVPVVSRTLHPLILVLSHLASHFRESAHQNHDPSSATKHLPS